ncbi:hypothetical protein [Roseovarius sp. A-2]|uniref:hypothetical protein n=1 Tax=Roseovarius sp. A-2 TaxID=1570360 RepID=UPI0027D7A334|nr:hypothetical protein [Roseovarius sp. A-2]
MPDMPWCVARPSEFDKIIDRADAGYRPRGDDRGFSGGKPRKRCGGLFGEIFDS